jgi:pimeloyl-ACP methyl ester carboxylesterase
MKWRWALAGAYAAALVASAAVRNGRAEPALPHDMNAVAIKAIGGRPADRIRLAFREYAGSAASTPIVLIHGSPGSSDVLTGLASMLAPARRVIVPDLPGFGSSTTNIPDYSFRAHAGYVHELLDARGINKVHVLAFSMGGGVALSLGEMDPDRVASLTMVSAIGVQEMELLGEYHINHAVHGVQLSALWMLSHAIPHTGSLDAPWPYARNFFDSDQRPLAAALRHVRVPTLIVHGRVDPLVPIETAIEHRRLVPQSELRVIDEDHFMVFEHPELIAPIAAEFLSRVDAGVALTRESADRERVLLAGAPFDRRIVPQARAVTAGVLGALTTAGSAVSVNVAPVAAGVLAAQGRSSHVLAFVCAVLGSCLPLIRRRSEAVLRRAAVNAVAKTSVGILVGTIVLRTAWLADANAWTRAAAATALALSAIELVALLCSPRQRGLLRSTVLRLTRWEYWPPWITYVPVVVYVIGLAVRHRSVTVFTAANPAMPAGGFVGESKIEILRGLAGSGGFIARSGVIDRRFTGPERVARAEQIMQALAVDIPVVLKPNEGQRGSGVVVARSREQMAAHLASTAVDTIVQEYVPGLEFGVFYYRRPTEARGHILSITVKHLPFVVGDGRRTLEQLILRDRRALGMARFHLQRQAAHVTDVPAAGEIVSLGDCGSHCRGATFLDGRALLTPALEQVFDRVARSYEGFCFGRFDVRAPTLDDFMQARSFKIIELNGVTSEATHIYDPEVSLLDAYRALFEQWRLAYEIGAENAARGAAVTSVRSLLWLVVRYRESSRPVRLRADATY